MKLIRPGLQWYVDKIKDNDPFTFIRYGDGEWSAIINDGRAMTGSRSHKLTIPAMQEQLRQSLLEKPVSDRYIIALRETALNAQISNWITNSKVKGWHDCTVFYKASRRGQLFPLLDAIRQSDFELVVIGPPNLSKLQAATGLPVKQFIPIPKRNCFGVITEKIKMVLEQKEKPMIISISAGPPGKLIAWRLFKHIGNNSFIIDFGSLWDVYSGSPSRKYQRNMKKETITKNLGAVK